MGNIQRILQDRGWGWANAFINSVGGLQEIYGTLYREVICKSIMVPTYEFILVGICCKI